MRLPLSVVSLVLAIPGAARAGEDHPYAGDHFGPLHFQLDADAIATRRYVTAPVEQPDLGKLDAVRSDTDAFAGPPLPGRAVLPPEVASGELTITPDAIFAVEDIPGNKYPRKHTLYINFNGGMLTSGSDNSAEDISNLAKNEVYPTYGGGEAQATAVAQAVAEDVSPYGIVVTYLERPEKIVPYTMAMVGGEWTDTNTDSPSGGVAPGADCGALGQRHVVYTFSTQATVAANTTSQEAGHAWGLDHVFNCSSVMSYCTSGDADFQTTCAGLCESQCQGPNSAGCQLTHEMFCGAGSVEQNDDMELAWIFGGNEPDMEAPTVEIVEPAGGEVTLELVDGAANLNMKTEIDDNYGGFGWQYTMTQEGVADPVIDAVDYERMVDDDYRAWLSIGFIEPGEFVITVKAQDHFENVTEAQLVVHVVGQGQGGDSSGGPADTSVGTTAMTGFDEGSGGSDGTTGGVDDPGEKGCGCASTTPRAPLGLALVVLAAAVRRRRGVGRA